MLSSNKSQFWNFFVWKKFLLVLLIVVYATVSSILPDFWKHWVGEKSPTREFFALIYLFTNSMLVVVVLLGVFFARTELHEVALARKANVFLEIEARWSSERVQKSRSEVVELADLFKQNSVGKESLQEYITRILKQKSFEDRAEATEVLAFFEMLGLMVRRDYVDEADIDSILRGTIVWFCFDVFDHYIKDCQTKQQERSQTPSNSRKKCAQGK